MSESRRGKIIVECSRDRIRRSFNTSRPVKMGEKFRLRWPGEEWTTAEVVAYVGREYDEVPWLDWKDDMRAEVSEIARTSEPAEKLSEGRSTDGHCHPSGDGNHRDWDEHGGHPAHRHDTEGRTEWAPRPARPAFDLGKYAEHLMRRGMREMTEGLRDVEEGERLKKGISMSRSIEDASAPGATHETPQEGDTVKVTITGTAVPSCSLPGARLAIKSKTHFDNIYLDEADSVEIIERAEKLEDYHVYEDARGRKYLYSSGNGDRPFLHISWAWPTTADGSVGFDVPVRPLRDITKAEEG